MSFVSLAQFKWGVKFIRLGKDIATAIQTGNVSDWITASSPMFGMLADLKAMSMDGAYKDMIMDGKEWGSSKEFYKENMAEIIAWTLVVIALLEFALLGWGKPETGKDLSAAGDQFKYANENLDDALPGESWHGKAAMAYLGQVAAQKALVDAMKDCDTRLALELSQEAAELKYVRNAFTLTQDSLSVCIPIAMALLWSGPPWPNVPLSKGFQITMCAVAIGDLIYWVQKMVRDSHDHANNVARVTADYNELTASARSATQLITPTKQPEALKSSVSSFDPIAASLHEFAMPSFTTLATSGMARVLEEQDAQPRTSAPTGTEEDTSATTGGQPPLIGARTGDGVGAGTGDPQEATWTPSLGQISKALGPFAQMAGPASQVMNQLMGQVNQLASMAQQGGKAAAAPVKAAEHAAEGAAHEGATLAGDERVVEPGAVGAPGAERAPVDVGAVGARQAPEPSPVQRIL